MASDSMVVLDGQDATEAHQFLAQKMALKLEGLGMRHSSGRSMLEHVGRVYGLYGDRAAVLADMEWLAKLVINHVATVASIRVRAQAGKVMQCPECAANLGAAHREDCPAS